MSTESGLTLDVYRASTLAQADEWLNLHDDEMRRRAVRAAGNRDAETLVSLTKAFLTQQSHSGVLTGPGATPTTRTPSGPYSRESPTVMLSIAAFMAL